MGANHFESLIPVAEDKEVKADDQTADAVVSDDAGADEFADTVVWENNKSLTENGEGSVQLDVDSLVAEFEAEAVVELSNGPHQTEVAFLNQVQKRHTTTRVFPGDT